MSNKNILLAVLFAACTAAWAEQPGDAFSDAKADKHVADAGPAGHPTHIDSMTMHMPTLHARGKLVRNAPYSAEVIAERVQNLPDGNQIVNKTSTMTYRDSAGRTRQEARDSRGELKRIAIVDATEQVSYVLYPKDKHAIKTSMKLEREAARLAADKARERVDQLRKEGKLPAGEPGDGNVIVKRIERSDASGNPQRSAEDVQVRVAQSVSAGLNVELARVAPLVATAFNDVKWAQRPATRELGSKDFDGVKADGKMRSYEIPAGEVGNKNPITVSSESWYSPELQITVYSKQSDPRSGDRIYRLANLKRDEPAAALFTVPSDYTVKEMNPYSRTVVEKIEKK